jgi:hypothetical protein
LLSRLLEQVLKKIEALFLKRRYQYLGGLSYEGKKWFN